MERTLLVDPLVGVGAEAIAHRLNQVLRKATGLAQVVAGAAEAGIPVPCFSSTLDYINSYRSGRLPQNLVQAMRDCFGSHTYQRVDKEGTFHTEWLS